MENSKCVVLKTIQGLFVHLYSLIGIICLIADLRVVGSLSTHVTVNEFSEGCNISIISVVLNHICTTFVYGI